MIFDGFGSHFGKHFGIKIASNNRSKNQSDFGSILEGFFLPLWIHFGQILAPKIDQKSRSIFDMILNNLRGGSGGTGGAQGGPNYHRTWTKTLESMFYTPREAPGRCCGGLSTLRRTPPQHLFDVGLLWNNLWPPLASPWPPLAPLWPPFGLPLASLGLLWPPFGSPLASLGVSWALLWRLYASLGVSSLSFSL